MLTEYQKNRLTYYHILSQRVRLTTEEGYDFAFMPRGRDPLSGFWRYDNKRHRHNLVVNEAVDELATKAATPYLRLMFAARVYDHEGAHSLFTDRDNPKLVKEQARFGIPFHLWNLFEDARIEAAWRRRFKRRFRWLSYQILNGTLKSKSVALLAPESATDLFLDCIRIENSYQMATDWVKSDPNPKVLFQGEGKKLYGRRYLILWFYRRAIKALDTMALLPWILAWVKTFPETGSTGGSSRGTGIPGVGEDIAAGGEMPADARDADGNPHVPCKETISSSGTGAGTDATVAPKASREEEEIREITTASVPPPEIPKTMFFTPVAQRVMDTRKADRLIRSFEKFLTGGTAPVTTRNPGGRINMRQVIRQSPEIYQVADDDPLGVKKISFIMDCSGSMSRAIEDGVYLAYVLNQLVRKRKIECKNMILSGGKVQTIPMPFDYRILDYIQAPGHFEGFVRAMTENEAELISSDMTIFFTDGNITDEHIVKADWHRKGVYSVGLFVGNPERSSTLHKWFDSVLVRHDIESVADSLLQLIKRHQ